MVPVELGVNSSMKNYVTLWSGRVMPNAAQPGEQQLPPVGGATQQTICADAHSPNRERYLASIALD
jgi:hypothetical protein